MSEYVDFHYMPLEGKITGEQVLKQTEDAINDLGNKVYSLDIDQSEIDEAIEKSNEAINTANSALSAVTTGRSVWFNNVAEMVATDIEAGVTSETKGYYVANDGGNALYLIRQEKSGDVVDGGSLIALDNGNMAELVTDGTVNVKQFGAIGNGTDDDTTVFQNTSSYAQAKGFVPFVGVATYKITGGVTGTFNSFGEVTITGGGTVDIINLQEVVSDVSDIRDEVVDETSSAKVYSESAATSATNASNSASSASTTATQLMAYLEDKETLTAPAVDHTLTISGAAADAKVTGDKVSFLKDIDLKALSGESYFPNMVQGGLDNTTAELTTQVWAVSSPDWFSFDYPVELHVAEGYQFRAAEKNRETGVVSVFGYDKHNFPGRVMLSDTSDHKIMIARDPISYAAADPDTFAKQVTFSLPSWYIEQVNKMNIEKLKDGNCLLDGLMARGSYLNGNYVSYVKYRVATGRIIQFNYDITISAITGFRFAIQTFNDDDTFKEDLGWETLFTVPANQKFIVIIARTANTEDTSETADIMYFWNQLNVSTPLKELVEVGSASVNFLRDFFKCGGKPKLCSHAGYKVGSIENSIPAFEAAGENGYWCLESDVQQTSDGYFIMMHDTTVDRTTDGTGSISSMTLAQIRALHLKGFPDLQVPTLQEYLAICKRYNMVPQLEIKGTVSNHASLIAEIKKAGMYWNTMLSGSVYSISSVRQVTNDIPYIGIAQAGFYPSGYDAFITTMKAYKNTGVALEYTGTITDANIQTCHDANMPICVFTCDTESTVQEMFELGADCVTTNVVLP